MLKQKHAIIVLVLVIGFVLSACSGGSKEANSSAGASSGAAGSGTEKTETGEQSGIEVDKGLLNVEITLPASFFDEEEMDQAIAKAKADGVNEVIVNDDGSVTYKMSKATHEKMLKEMKDSLVQLKEELTSGEDFKSIKDIVFNDKLTEFTMTVDRGAFENSFEGFAILGLGFQGMFYQTFDGVPSENIKVTIHLKDEKTGEVFNTVVYPDAWESLGQ